MDEWTKFKKELLKSKEVYKEYKKLEPKYRLISQLIAARKKENVTQKQLAKKIGTKQSAIARLENGNANPTLSFLEKISYALNTKLLIELG
ncbi:MAG: helix-turn-helix transcriptional regulator [Patescibacteria group bacterium]